jgi:hypothetical protein
MEQNKTINSLLPLGVTNAVSAVNSTVNNMANTIVKNTTKLANNLPSLPSMGSLGANVANTVSNATNSLPSMPSMPSVSAIPWLPIVFFVSLVVVFVVLLVKFNDQVRDGYLAVVNKLREALGYSSEPPPPIETTTPTTAPPKEMMESSAPSNGVVEKILPPAGNAQVFNISKNTFTYYDAEPLCRALGAELATYEQVKDAWEKGADWCNYGWVKGQMAVYPTQKETWEKLQSGPEEQRMACGNPGLNGGYFDNPELRYGVNCYGEKPSQSKHDATQVAKGTPLSPGALEFDKKVSAYRSQADSIGVLPFNTNKWSA